MDNEQPEGVVGRIRLVVSCPLRGGNPQRHQFAIGLILLAIFQMVLVAVSPHDSRRWPFFAFAWIWAESRQRNTPSDAVCNIDVQHSVGFIYDVAGAFGNRVTRSFLIGEHRTRPDFVVPAYATLCKSTAL